MLSVLSPDKSRPPTTRKGTLHSRTHTHNKHNRYDALSTVLADISMQTYPQPRAINTVGLSLNRSSLLIRARQSGIKPETRRNATLTTHIFESSGRSHTYTPVQMYVLYRELYSRVNVTVLPRKLSSFFTREFHRIILMHTKNYEGRRNIVLKSNKGV